MRAMSQLIALAMLVPSISASQEPPAQGRGASSGTARAISVVATVAPIVLGAQIQGVPGTLLGASAVLVGPSTGYWAGHSDGWQRGLFIRGVAGGVAALFAGSMGDCGVIGPNPSHCDSGAVGIAGAGVVILVSAVVDIVKVGGAVRGRNARTGQVSFVPPLGHARGRWGIGFTQPF